MSVKIETMTKDKLLIIFGRGFVRLINLCNPTNNGINSEQQR